MATCQPCPASNKFLPYTRYCWRAIPIFFLLSGFAGAQSKLLPGIEVFGGYSHLSFQSGNLGFGPWTQMNGWQFSLSVPHIWKDLGVTADASGHYSTALEQYNYTIGPQYKYEFSRFRVTAHGMYGRAQTRIRQPGSTFTGPSDRHRSLIFGGELDYPIGDRLMWRIVEGDLVSTSAFGNTQNNIRVSTGLVFKLGKH
jgi:hypothetical protein